MLTHPSKLILRQPIIAAATISFIYLLAGSTFIEITSATPDEYDSRFRVTVLLPDDYNSALEFSNARPEIDPVAKPVRLEGDVFEFQIADDIHPDSALQLLRSEGLLVNPVIELGDGRAIFFGDRVVVQYKPGVSNYEILRLDSAIGCLPSSESKVIAGLRYAQVVDPLGRSITEIAGEYAASSLCAEAWPEKSITPLMRDEMQPDYRFAQWPLENAGGSGGVADADIDAAHAWQVTVGDTAVKVALLDCNVWAVFGDSRFFATPPDSHAVQFIDARDPAAWYLNPEACNPILEGFRTDPVGRGLCAHGPGILGIMAATHDTFGIDGVAPGCRYTGLRLCDDNLTIRDEVAAAGLRWAGFTLNAKIIVNTWDYYPWEVTEWVETPRVLDSLRTVAHAAIFFAAGNEGGEILSWSAFAANPNVYAIGATNRSDARWSYSNHGPEIDFVAPAGLSGTLCPPSGDEITWDLGGWGGLSPVCSPPLSKCVEGDDDSSFACGVGGTSTACPKVAGIAALILSAHPEFLDSIYLDTADVGDTLYKILQASAEDKGDSGYDNYYGWGRVNAARALALLAVPGDPNFDGVYDILDVVCLVNAAFRLACVPVYEGAGDLNCDGEIDVLDVVHMVGVALRNHEPDSHIVPCKTDLGGPMCCPPPRLIYPPDGTTALSLPFTFDWETLPWASDYHIEVDDDRAFNSPAIATSTTQSSGWNSVGLSENTTYYWRVQVSGADCVAKTCAMWTFTTGPSSPVYSGPTNSVEIESREVNCGDTDITVGIYISNAIPLSALVLPLEIRSTSGEAFLSNSLSLEVKNRLVDKLAAYPPVSHYLPDKDAAGNSCGGSGYSTRGDLEDPDLESPEAVVFLGVATEESDLLDEGSDSFGNPSLELSFDISKFQGTIEIDTTCVSPGNHLLYVDGRELLNTVSLVPEFTKGVITVNGISELSGHVAESDTFCCNVAMTGDVIIDSGTVLTVLSGRELRASSFVDETSGGEDPNLVELTVYGELTLGPDALLGSDSSAEGAWYGIRLMPGGQLNVESGAVIENAVVGVTLESGADLDTLTRLNISNCAFAGIWSMDSSTVIASNTISDIPGGYGISIWDASPLVIGNTISNCETGIDVLRSSSTIRGNRILGPGMHGIFVSHYDESYPGLDTLRVVDDSVNGYFSVAHLYAASFGHCRIDSCEFISQYVAAEQSPYGIKSVQDVWIKVRRSKVQAYGVTGVYSYKSKMNLGKTKFNNGGVDDLGNNDIQTDSAAGCEELCITRRAWHVGSTSTDTMRAEGNWWDSVPPPSNWFNGLVDRTPYLDEPPLGKRSIEVPGTASVPKSAELGQNYPNPFNPSTTVSFSIPSQAHVKLMIYNLLGQQVSVLADREFEPGSYSLTWNGRDDVGTQLASGVYFYRLIAGDYVESKKMVLLK